MSTASYQAFQERRAALTGLLDRAAAAFAGLDMKTWAQSAGELRARVASDRFRVMVLGEFKRGKSTLINALLHAEVLPADIAPCTAVINEVKWGDAPRALLYFRQPLPERHGALPADARRHLEKHRGGPVPPLEIPVGDLAEFVRIPDPTADQAASVAESPYDRVEIFWPLDLCRNGVEIIDSPGLNEHHTRTKTTRDYLAQIDAVVFVLTVHALASESELAVIDHDLLAAGHRYLFFLCNRFDELRKREDREKIAAFAYAKLAERTRFGREGVFFVSAMDALEGRTTGDASLVARSGLPQVERALERFLAEERGRVKLLQPAGTLARGLKSALAEIVPTRRQLLAEGVGALQLRLTQIQPQLDQALRRRDNVLRQVEAARQRVRDAVRREAERCFANLAQDVVVWARKLETATIINALKVWDMAGQRERVAREMADQLLPATEAALQAWEQKELRPLLEQQMAELTEAVNLSLEPYLIYLDAVKAQLTGRIAAPQAVVAQAQGLLSLERVLTGAGGAALGAGVMVAAIVPGIGQAVASLGLIQVTGLLASKVGLLVWSLVNPITVTGMVVGTLAMARHRGQVLTEQVKAEVAAAIAAQLRKDGATQAAAIADEVYANTAQLAEAIAAGMERELLAVREQVDGVIRDKTRSETEAQARRADLDRREAEVRALDLELNDLILALS